MASVESTHRKTIRVPLENDDGAFIIHTVVQNRGKLNDRENNKIQSFFKQNYKEMYFKWTKYGEKGFFGE